MELQGLLSCGFSLFKSGMGKIAWQGEGCSNTELDLSLGLLSFWTSGIKVPTLPWLVPCALLAFSHLTPPLFLSSNHTGLSQFPYSSYYFLPQGLYMHCPSAQNVLASSFLPSNPLSTNQISARAMLS